MVIKMDRQACMHASSAGRSVDCRFDVTTNYMPSPCLWTDVVCAVASYSWEKGLALERTKLTYVLALRQGSHEFPIEINSTHVKLKNRDMYQRIL